MRLSLSVVSTILLFLSSAMAVAESSWDKSTQNYQGNKEITVYRAPNCQCCHKWIKHLEKHNFTVIDMLTQDMASVKDAVKLPRQMTSCHTALIDGYVIEGHVPADDIKRLLTTKPDIAGLSVPQMPVGTPGMEMGEKKDNFVVFSFDKLGEFNSYEKYQYDATSSGYMRETSHTD
jgi:hypothetical protein